jgi:hypothetical protein
VTGRVLVLEERTSPPSSHDAYRFQDASGARSAWPTRFGEGLGAAGAWNVLWRLGLIPRLVRTDGVPAPGPGDLLVAPLTMEPAPALLDAVAGWLDGGGTVVSEGAFAGWTRFLPEGSRFIPQETLRPYAAVALVLDGALPQIVAPPAWRYARYESAGDVETIGRLVLVHGERQTPSRALVTPLESAPGCIRRGRFIHLNGSPFAAFQAWLQGQEDLGPWIAWRHRLFWLDEAAAALGRLLEASHAIPPVTQRSGVPGLDATTIVLRHDLDESTDTAYLDEEVRRGWLGVHGILRGPHERFWLDRLRSHPTHEGALHYNTIASSWIGRRVSALRRKPESYRPARAEIVATGLRRQVRQAAAAGIPVESLLRHGPFLLYPEWVDALHCVFESEPAVRGSSSLFRGQVLRWGADRLNGSEGVAEFPDSQFPLWMPFRLGHAGLQGRLLRGWEATSVMEIEPELFEQMLDHPAPDLPQRVFVLNFHPAHARRPTLAPGGFLPDFQRILETIRERGLAVRTLRDVFTTCDRAASAEPPR